MVEDKHEEEAESPHCTKKEQQSTTTAATTTKSLAIMTKNATLMQLQEQPQLS